MRGHNIRFYEELTKIIPDYQQILHLIKSSNCISLDLSAKRIFREIIEKLFCLLDIGIHLNIFHHYVKGNNICDFQLASVGKPFF